MGTRKTCCTGVLVGFVLIASQATRGELLNPGFEEGGGSLSHWSTFNNWIPNIVPESITPHSGSAVVKLFGGFNGNPNYSGLLQSVPAEPGQHWEAAAFVRHNTGDSLAGTPNSLAMKIEFYRVVGGAYGTTDMVGEGGAIILDGDSPTDSWLFQSYEAIAPADTVEARISIVFINVDNAGGAALLDDVALSLLPDAQAIEWDLIWNDEFDDGLVDLSKWRVEDAFLIKNNELQYYAPDDVYEANGVLTLRSQDRTYNGHPYTSGLVESVERFGTAYGRIEVRAQLPFGQGIWPAHWMLPTSGAWPPEIDIMELLGHEPTRVYMTHHWGTWPAVQWDGGSFAGPDFSGGFHTFAIEWMPSRIDWFVDGTRRFTSATSIPGEPFYIILNTAVGGNWPGDPDPTTVFPQYHDIDYVRVYTLSDPGLPIASVVDDTPWTATVDAAVGPSEYVGSMSGINSGFGDRIGAESLFHIDTSDDGSLCLGIESATAWPSPSADGVVVYMDSRPAGFASTFELRDLEDSHRRLVSGKGSAGQRGDLYFAPGFRADYAIAIQNEFVGVYELSGDAHTLINGAFAGSPADVMGGDSVHYASSTGGLAGEVREIRARLSDVGVAQGAEFRFVVTLLNGDNGYRSSEFVGVATGKPWDASNPGNVAAVLDVGDFAVLRSVAPTAQDIPATSEWGLVIFGLLVACVGTVLSRRTDNGSAPARSFA